MLAHGATMSGALGAFIRRKSQYIMEKLNEQKATWKDNGRPRGDHDDSLRGFSDYGNLPCHESVQDGDSAVKALNFLHRLRWLHIENGLALFRVSFDSPMSKDEA